RVAKAWHAHPRFMDRCQRRSDPDLATREVISKVTPGKLDGGSVSGRDRVAAVLVTLAAVVWAVIPLMVDPGPTHIFHPAWSSHARFHAVLAALGQHHARHPRCAADLVAWTEPRVATEAWRAAASSWQHSHAPFMVAPSASPEACRRWRAWTPT